ncbi:MAG: bifunctional 5,10-methylenetetrahydrofolate dehydrogenase/5,10-methenyltetrahydrofolate cyclohydrolase [Candidatus Fimivivens sp.]|nr:bifunctional 5,10-methylenetetrahydrofolate dehydrogenase/5,10-methenyltetrahydrofolate cyclohydrolase [Candidatus Fimivivens sp.]
MGILLKGAETAVTLTEKARERAVQLHQKGVEPTLAIVRVGEREDDLAYERGATKRCAQAGVAIKPFVLSDDAGQPELLKLIEKLNADSTVHGVLIMRPLPEHFDEEAVCRALSPEKDVDGITEGSVAGVYSGSKKGFAPCTAQACVEILKYYNIPTAGRRAVVVGRSLVIGKPVAMLLLAEDMTVTVCHTKTDNLPAVCKEADVLVVAAGKAGVVGAESVCPGQVVLDVGIHVGKDNKICGDVRTSEVEEIVYAVTPVPGGVGAVTTSVLALNVVTAAERMI